MNILFIKHTPFHSLHLGFFLTLLIGGYGLHSAVAQPSAPQPPNDPNVRSLNHGNSITEVWTGPVERVPEVDPEEKPSGVTNLQRAAGRNLGLAVLEARAKVDSEGDAILLTALEAAAKQGHAEAEFKLGQHWLQATEPDFPKAARWFMAAQRQGHREAEFELAQLTREGKGVSRDPYRAFALYSQAAEKDHPETKIQRGIMLVEGNGVRRNLEEAIPLLIEIPDDERGAKVHWVLAQAYSSGRDLDFDPSKAATHWVQAAQGGNKDALDALLALLLGRSELAPGDNPDLEALRAAATQKATPSTIYTLAQQAEELKLDKAPVYLGICYAQGVGVAQDPEKARQFLGE